MVDLRDRVTVAVGDAVIKRRVDAVLTEVAKWLREHQPGVWTTDEVAEEIEVMISKPAAPAVPLDTILSVRLPGNLAARLRDHANSRQESTSDVIRRAVQKLILDEFVAFCSLCNDEPGISCRACGRTEADQ